ncbi:MAG: hypothetical protein KJZ54_08700 [Phycisphaerales bacterium]|nr:hypothetical protein [Phycisphaerales bacterium]
MFIKQIVIEGVEGDVEIRRTEHGAVVIANDIEVEVARDDSREERYAVAYNAAKVVCGTTKRGEPNATNSMIHDVLNEIERVAGC